MASVCSGSIKKSTLYRHGAEKVARQSTLVPLVHRRSLGDPSSRPAVVPDSQDGVFLLNVLPNARANFKKMAELFQVWVYHV